MLNRGVEHRLYRHTHRWKPETVMPERECEILTDEIIKISGSALSFILEHVEGDAFYAKAYKDWVATHIPVVERALSQLFYHSVVATYTIRGMDIRWRWAENWGIEVQKRMVSRLSLEFEKYVDIPETMPRNVGADALWLLLDSTSLRMKIGAQPEMDKLDGWTERHYKSMLESGSAGQQAHYMSMKLGGGMFQFELVKPHRVSSNPYVVKRVKLAETKLGKRAIQWLNK